MGGNGILFDWVSSLTDGIDGNTQWCRPAAQGMSYDTQLLKCGDRGLPPRRRGNAADRQAVKITTIIPIQIFNIIQRIFHKAGNRTVITG